MPVYRIPREHFFPPVSEAEYNGLLGLGGDLHPDRLLLAYKSGIFPWYSQGQPILWFSPDPRFVLIPQEFRISRSLKKFLKRHPFRFTIDQAFNQVIRACAEIPRPHQSGTWITEEMVDAYIELHERGVAHSFEAWMGDELVGGFYGVSIGRIFAGESMFARHPNASKVAFCWGFERLLSWGVVLLDSQVYTEHLERFGAREIPRDDYMRMLTQYSVQSLSEDAWTIAEEAELDSSSEDVEI